MMKILFTIFSALLPLVGCRPAPIDITVPQRPAQLAISATVLSDNIVLVTATYSIQSLANLDDTTGGKTPSGIPAGILPDSALVTISDIQGLRTDTMRRIAPGVFAHYGLQLRSGGTYTMNMLDYRTGQAVQANATYLPAPSFDTLRPLVTRNGKDTTVELRVALSGAAPSDYYIIAYSPLQYGTLTGLFGGENLAAGTLNPVRRLKLLRGSDALNGSLRAGLHLDGILPEDTLYIHAARIDRGYYDYLAAYQRAGGVISQLTGEPVTLPTNVPGGLGYFGLSLPVRSLFALKEF